MCRHFNFVPFISSSLVRRAIRAIIGRGITAASALILTVILPWFLSAAEVGEIYFTLTAAALVSIFARWGIDNVANARIVNTNDQAEEKSEKENLLYLGIISSFLCCLTWGALTYLTPLPHILQIPSSAMWPIGLMSAALSVSFLMFQLYRIDGAVTWAALTRGFFLSLSLILSVCITQGSLGSAGIFTLASYILISFTVINVAKYCYSSNLHFMNIKFCDARNYFSFKLLIYSLLLYTISDADLYFIKGTLSNADLGVYATVKRSAVMMSIYTDIAHLILPSTYKNHTSTANRDAAILGFRRLATFGFIGSVLVFSVFAVSSDVIIQSLWGTDYLTGKTALLILLIGFALTMACGFSEMWLLLNGDRDALAYSMAGVLTLCISLNAFLTPHLGISGAALSFAISNLVLRVGLMLYVRSKYKVWLAMGWGR